MSKPASDLRLINVSCPDMDVAGRIARLLVDRRLAASVQIVPGVTTVIRWGGEVSEEAEVLLQIRSREEFVESIFTAVVANHPYQPVIDVLAIEHAGRGVAAWIRAETGGEATVALPKGFKGAEE